MSFSITFEKGLKPQLVGILISGSSRTAEQLYSELRKKGMFCTKSGLYKALNELLNDKIILKHKTNYEINSQWISELGSDANTALRKLLEKNLVGRDAKHLTHVCDCSKGNTEGFCAVCFGLACSHCAVKKYRHHTCNIKCLNCDCGRAEGECILCGEKVCLGCGKEFWLHENQFCKKKETAVHAGILEVDHDCWFSNTSERNDNELILSNFSDKKDEQLNTHSGIVRISKEDKDKLLSTIIKQGAIKEARLIHKDNNSYYIRTRASADKSVDSLTKSNRAVLMNPIFASDSKEQNLVLAPSHEVMKALSKSLQEFGGKVRLRHADTIEEGSVSNKKVQEFIDKVPKKKLLDAMQRMKIKE